MEDKNEQEALAFQVNRGSLYSGRNPPVVVTFTSLTLLINTGTVTSVKFTYPGILRRVSFSSFSKAIWHIRCLVSKKEKKASDSVAFTRDE